MKILFTGGGTAGHVFPIVAVIREMKKNYPHAGFEFFYLGPKDKFSKELLLKEGVEVKTILAGKIRRYFSFKNVTDMFKLPIGILQAFYHIFIISPDVIFSKGGYGSIATSICGRILMVPIFLHESDISPGLANRITGKFALEIFISFPIKKTEYFSAKKMLSVGNPVRKEILNGSKEGAKKLFNLTGEKPVILILGGSQGAQRINDKILSILPNILKDYEIIHQTGQRNFEQVRKEADVVITEDFKKYYHPFPFLNETEIANAYSAADLIVSRAGAGTIFEIALMGKPSILVPLPESAQDHQVKNAYAYAENGASLVIEEANLRPHFVLERIKNLFSQPERLEQIAERAKEFSRPNAARIIAEYIVTYLSQ
ncbi:undecaprenyldiphospho-muramoylpentapeptide beta-N-acetylglucosaminyltransferase [Patescibacteria group bacterium]|nr:undecaprenyldiphospho-muramoylpentapeptide beta-N-acetylglucosaminyltransferase [Patescibacteria group bacterium]